MQADDLTKSDGKIKYNGKDEISIICSFFLIRLVVIKLPLEINVCGFFDL